MTTFLHTADWQLGKPFARVADATKRAMLQQERLVAIERLGAVAREKNAEFVVVAGDLFDSPSVTRATVAQACARVGALGVPVYVIPGNHDPGCAGSIWESDWFRYESSKLAPNLRVLLKPEPVVLESAVLFPCPLLRKHESSDLLLWLQTLGNAPAGQEKDWEGRSRIVLAHGSTADFGDVGRDDEETGVGANRLNLERLRAEDWDYVALGDWHGTKQVGARAWYSGTPELDRFPKGQSNDPGNVLVVKVARKRLPEVEKVRVAKLRWHEAAFDFTGHSDLGAFERVLQEVLERRAGEDLLRLSLGGLLGIRMRKELDAVLESLEARLLRLKLEDTTRIAPSEEEISELTARSGDPLIGQVARRLTELAQGGGEEAATAQLALCELHHLSCTL